MVAPRQFCFDTLHGWGPRSAPGPSGGRFSAFYKMGSNNGVQKWRSKWDTKMGSKNGVQNGVLDFGWLPKMVAPRQFCFDTLDGRGPRWARGPSGGHFSAFSKMRSNNGVQKWRSKWDPKMRSKNGVQKWGPTWGPKWDPKMGSKMGSLIWGGSPKWSLQDSFALTL